MERKEDMVLFYYPNYYLGIPNKYCESLTDEKLSIIQTNIFAMAELFHDPHPCLESSYSKHLQVVKLMNNFFIEYYNGHDKAKDMLDRWIREQEEKENE